MSYTKLSPDPFDPTDTLTELCKQNFVEIVGLPADLVGSGSFVTLDTGEVVWVGCVLHDDPNTVAIDFLSAVFACDGAGPKRKPNGQIVGSTAWRAVTSDLLDTWGIDTIRKAAMMICLEEPQPRVAVPTPVPGGPTEQDIFMLPPLDCRAASIRSALRTASQLTQATADVL